MHVYVSCHRHSEMKQQEDIQRELAKWRKLRAVSVDNEHISDRGHCNCAIAEETIVLILQDVLACEDRHGMYAVIYGTCIFRIAYDHIVCVFVCVCVADWWWWSERSEHVSAELDCAVDQCACVAVAVIDPIQGLGTCWSCVVPYTFFRESCSACVMWCVVCTNV